MRRKPHVLLIPFPAQGHVGPLMKLARLISDHGIQVTVVNSDFIHAKLSAAAGLPPEEAETEPQSPVRLASVPDGLEPGDDRRDLFKLMESLQRVVPDHLKELIEKVNSSNDEQVSCVVADITLRWWVFEVVEKMGIQAVPFCPFAPECLVLSLQIPKLIDAGVINGTDGSPLTDALICDSKGIPVLSRERLPWRWPIDDRNVKHLIFQFFLSLIQYTDIPNRLLCNCFYELDSSACESIPNILPIGPLFLTDNQLGRCSGKFWREDDTCISWLDQQPVGSVIYVAFGSIAYLTQSRFSELALGLELTGRPFLWVVRSDFSKGSAAEFPDGFMGRVAGRGKIVTWAPQGEVLAHPSVACFLSHCGWNSTMDGISRGIPILCWPCFTDQFVNQNYICNKWKVGLKLEADPNGFISRDEVKDKIENLVSAEGIKANAENLKEMARRSVSEGGSSYNNFKTFIEEIKQRGCHGLPRA